MDQRMDKTILVIPQQNTSIDCVHNSRVINFIAWVGEYVQ